MFQNSNRTLEELLKLELQELYLKWGGSQPPRAGLHASSLLVVPQEWCVRRYVLADLHPEEAEAEDLKHWDWQRQAVFLDGWERHRKFQKLLRDFANVVYFRDQPETDLTHHDETRNIFFSPDAIIDYAGVRYVVEIKGLDTNKFQQLTNNLDTACKVADVLAKAKIQCNLYCHLLAIKRGLLLIEDKNTQAIKVWVIECDPLLAVPFVQRAYDVKGAVVMVRQQGPSKLPERVCATSDDRLARRCPMCRLCFANRLEKK